MNIETLKKQRKIIDQMITAHAILHDKYRFYSGITDALLIGGSALLNGLVFLNFDTLKKVTCIFR